MLYVYEVQPIKYVPSVWKINLNFEEQPGKKGENDMETIYFHGPFHIVLQGTA
jgi:hypothetical protein